MLLVGAESAFRGVLRYRGTPYEGWRTERELRRIESSMTRGIPSVAADDADPVRRDSEPRITEYTTVLHPFTGYQPLDMLKSWTAHGLAFREPETFLVLVVGGSVAGQFATDVGQELEEQLLPALPASLRAENQRVHVLNHAVGGFKAPQQAALLVYLLSQGRRPDAVINIDGFNEVALGRYNADKKVHASYPSIQHWTDAANDTRSAQPEQLEQLRDLSEDVQSFVRTVRRLRLPLSAIGGTWSLRRVHQRWNRFIAAGGAYEKEMIADARPEMRGPRTRTGGASPLHEVVETWENHSRTLASLCRAEGIAYVHVLQPTLHDSGSKPLTADELRTGLAHDLWVEGVHHGYPLLRESGARLVADGVAFVDGSMLLEGVTETLYFDSCHLIPAGLRHFVPPILAALAKQL